MNTITWLHFSDLHLCSPMTEWEADHILKALRKDLIYLQKEHGLYPDFIFFTGDAAFGHRGKDSRESITDQFEDAAILFEEIREVFSPYVPAENIFIVPGNHDVNRKEVNEWIHNGLNEALQGSYDNVKKN